MFPLLGMLAYLLVGEVRIGRSRTARFRAVLARMPRASNLSAAEAAGFATVVPEDHRHLFQLGYSISGFAPVVGNRAHLLADFERDD